jgi:ribA/ribD-fused uncharacterized protein
MSRKEQLTHDRVNHPLPDDPVFFYPKEFYVFDNFSSFQVEYDGQLWPTSEHAFQAAKFKGFEPDVVQQVLEARSAHDAQKIAHKYKGKRNPDWEDVAEGIMKDILRCKVEQHPYVLKKLLESGDREIIEDSWRDSEWGWGENRDGENKLGKLWVEIREEFIENE